VVTEELRLAIADGVATVWIDQPAKRNALTQKMWDELTVLMLAAGADPAVRALLVRSATPGVFSSGADIGEYREFAGDVDWGMASQGRVSRALGAIRTLSVPSIAVIDGPCVGGGSGIALACDLRIVSERSTFAITPAKLGLVFPHEDTAALVDLVGTAAAKRILLTGFRFDAQWALVRGFVDEVHPADELDAAVAALLAEIAAAAPTSVRAMKRVVELVQQGVRGATPETDELVESALRGADHREGVTAFLERRAAVFG